jgi:hypothetical protein
MKTCLGVGAFVAMFAVSTLFSTARNVEEGGYTVDPCYKRCSSLLSHVTPQSEAQRVFTIAWPTATIRVASIAQAISRSRKAAPVLDNPSLVIASEAIQRAAQVRRQFVPEAWLNRFNQASPKRGLLRFARNDGVAP